MRPHPAFRRSAALAVLLCGEAIVPVAGWAHWEGFEAADPSTPAALLRFESAAATYSEARIAPVSWVERIQVDGEPALPDQRPAAEAGTGDLDAAGAGDTSGYTGVVQPAPTPIPE